MGAVTLAKLGDDVREDFPGVGTNHGPGTLQFIGGTPVRKVGGPLIMVAGMRVRLPEEKGMGGPARTVQAVAVAIEQDGTGRDRDGNPAPSFRGTVITAEGGEYRTGPRGSMEAVRLEWLRLAVESGTFQRVARMS